MLGKYIGHELIKFIIFGPYYGNLNFCLGALANTSQCQPQPNKPPGLAEMSKHN